MKVIAKSAFFNNGRIIKKGDKVEVETAAFNPLLMTEVHEVRAKKVSVEEKSVETPEGAPVEKKTRRKKKG